MVKISFRPNPDYKYMYDCVYQTKEQNKSLNQFIGKKLNSYWPRFSVLAEFFLYWPSFSILAEFVMCMSRLIWPYRYYINVIN